MRPDRDIPDPAHELLLDLRLFLRESGDRSAKTIKKWYMKAKAQHGHKTAEVALWLFEAAGAGAQTKGVALPEATAEVAKLRPDILLVTVNKHETQAVLEGFERATRVAAVVVPVEDRAYRNLGALNGTLVFHAISEMGSGGPGGMQQTVDKAIRALDPGAVIAIGIAFGVNEKKQAIGDILLSKQLRLYELQRVGKRRQITLRGDKPHASARLINFFEGVAQATWKGATVRPGVILTGEKLIDNVDYRKQLLNIESEAEGGEMEGAGLYVSGHDHKADWIVIKAICDWADGDKRRNKTRRQQKAARNASEFLIHALQQASLKRIA